jgi:hypothetical protein
MNNTGTTLVGGGLVAGALALAAHFGNVASHEGRPAASAFEHGTTPALMHRERRFEALQELEDPTTEVLKHCAHEAVRGESCIPGTEAPEPTWP